MVLEGCKIDREKKKRIGKYRSYTKLSKEKKGIAKGETIQIKGRSPIHNYIRVPGGGENQLKRERGEVGDKKGVIAKEK